MTFYEYNQLCKPEQYKALFKNGVMVGDRNKGEYKIVLYQVFSFYIELYYKKGDYKLKRLRGFASTERLDDEYVKHISLNDLTT